MIIWLPTCLDDPMCKISPSKERIHFCFHRLEPREAFFSTGLQRGWAASELMSKRHRLLRRSGRASYALVTADNHDSELHLRVGACDVTRNSIQQLQRHRNATSIHQAVGSKTSRHKRRAQRPARNPPSRLLPHISHWAEGRESRGGGEISRLPEPCALSLFDGTEGV